MPLFFSWEGGGRWLYTTLAVVCHEMCVELPPCNVYLQCLLVTIVVLIVVVVVVEFDWTGNPILLFYVMVLFFELGILQTHYLVFSYFSIHGGK